MAEEQKTESETSPIPPSTTVPSATRDLPKEFDSIVGIGNVLMDKVEGVAEAGSKANTANIAYMDKLMLLAGGTLTLTFTVIGSLSPHLHEIHKSAEHIYCVVFACWLLAACIILSLTFNMMTINLQRKTDINVKAISLFTKFKVILIAVGSTLDLSSIPVDVATKDEIDSMNMLRKSARYVGIAAQLSITLAFIFLILFVDANLPILLNSKY